MNTSQPVAEPDVRAIAFYLPQFHPIPENDLWWGKGFTEWTNVTKARPNFDGHYQPHLPADLGFYDIRLPETRQAQADLARQHGIYGFCYYHYWFNGRRILERPLDEVLRSGQPDYPFCVCWANENWSRRWDGGDNEVLLHQDYSADDDIAFIENLIPYFQDPRYIRVHGRPLLLVYKTHLLPNPKATAERWRRVCKHAGIPAPYLCAGLTQHPISPKEIGFDAVYEFPPQGMRLTPLQQGKIINRHPNHIGHFFDYRTTAVQSMNLKKPDFVLHRGIIPGWDNTPRKQMESITFLNSTPSSYEVWLRHLVDWERKNHPEGERMIFINAWNEWAEGAHLEPDRRHGRGYLEATQRALFG